MRRRGAVDSFSSLAEPQLPVPRAGDGSSRKAALHRRIRFKPGERARFRGLIESAGFAGLGRVLDVGCGYGRMSIFLAEVNDSVLGIDPKADGVEIARSLAAACELPNARFETASAREIPAEDGSFDGVWCFGGLNRLHRAEALAEIRRVLTDDGRFYVGKYNSIGMLLRKYLKHYRDPGPEAPLTRWARRALAHGPQFDGGANWSTPETIEETLARHGFRLADDFGLRVYPRTRQPEWEQRLLEDHETLLARLEGDPDFVEKLLERQDELLARLAGDLEFVAVKAPATLGSRAAIARHTRASRKVDLRPLPSRVQVARQKEAMAAAGMRTFPYPFASALTITSDCDLTNRSLYTAYIDEMVGRHGLDFGDSLWIAGQRSRCGPAGGRWCAGLPVMSPDLRLDAGHFEHEREFQLDPWEVLREHHRGNVDHWHSFHMRGPRVLVLRQWQADSVTGCLRAAVGEVELEDNLYRAAEFPVVAATLVVDPELEPESFEVDLVGHDGRRETLIRETNQELYRFLGRRVGEGTQLFFKRMYGALERRGVLHLDELAEVEVRYAGPLATDALRGLQLHNLHAELLLDRLEFLERELHFSTNLVTMHGLWHFYTAHRLELERKRVAALLRDGEADGKSLYAAADLPGARFSTLADDALSFVRVLPELTERFGIVFLRMTQSASYPSHHLSAAPLGRRHCSIHDVVYPVRARTGDIFYNLCAAFPQLDDEVVDELGEDGDRSRSRNFGARLERVVRDLGQSPGELAVLYTHLGWGWNEHFGWTDVDRRLVADRQSKVIDLKDRVFGISRTVPEASRIWFTRASVLADYALMAQTVPEGVTRPDPDTVQLDARFDPVLRRPLPESARQLYGSTFYVDRRESARVFLGGRELRDLWRNPADAGGRESVTIAECGIRHVAFDEIDPVRARRAGRAGGEVEIEGGKWSWRTHPSRAFRGNGFGILRLGEQPADEPGLPTARLALSGGELEPVGCQQLAYAVRRTSPAVAAGVLLETTTGGRFLFADRELLGAAPDPIARYAASPAPRDGSGWERIVVPFAALEWHGHADPATSPMPSHPPRRITLMVSGPAGEAAAFDALEYGRPKTTSPRQAGGRVVLGGRVAGAPAGTRVGVQPFPGRGSSGSDAARPAVSVATDELGGFWLPELAPGAYRIAVARSGESFDWAASTWVEAASDRFDLCLEAPAAERPAPPVARQRSRLERLLNHVRSALPWTRSTT